jgi:hypothetical protein
MNKPRKKKNESDEAYILRASKLYFSNGYHIDEIAERLDIPLIEAYNDVCHGHKITTEEERQEMIRLYGLGYSYNAISKIVGRSRSCVRERIKSPAKIVCTTKNRLTNKQIKQITDMIHDGAYITTIAKDLGLPRSVVSDRVRRCGLCSPKKPIDDKEIKKFIRLHKAGYTYEAIAKKCDRCVSTVSKYINMNK